MTATTEKLTTAASPYSADPPPSVVRRWRLRLGLVLAAVFVLYSTSFDLRLFADDYIAWTKVVNSMKQPWWTLFSAYYNPEFYRPFEHLLIRLNIWLIGADPLMYRVVTVIGHLLTVWSVFWLGRRWRLSHAESLCAALFFGLSHANTMAVASNDSASLVFSTLFGVVALGAVLRQRDDQMLPWRQAWFSALWLLGSLLWKDSAIGYVPALALILALEVFRLRPARRPLRALALAGPYVAVLVLYFGLRWHAHATAVHFGAVGRYGISFGPNVLANVCLFLLGLLTPVGSSIIALRHHDDLFLSMSAIAAIVTTVAFVLGLLQMWIDRADRRRNLVLLVALMFVLMAPDVLMNRISELYVYKVNAVFALLFGPALLALFRQAWKARRRLGLGFLALFLIALVVSDTFSVMHKLHRMRDNGLRAQRLMQEIKAQMPALASRKVIAVNRYPGPAPLYSIYYMEGVYVLGGVKALEFLYGAKIDDFRYYAFDKLEDGLAHMSGRKVVILYLRDHVYVVTTVDAINPFDPGKYK